METKPKKITLINKNVKKRRIIHLVTQTKKKSFKFASVNCKKWVKKYGYPFLITVIDEVDETGHAKKNSMTCESYSDLNYALEMFIKIYL